MKYEDVAQKIIDEIENCEISINGLQNWTFPYDIKYKIVKILKENEIINKLELETISIMLLAMERDCQRIRKVIKNRLLKDLTLKEIKNLGEYLGNGNTKIKLRSE